MDNADSQHNSMGGFGCVGVVATVGSGPQTVGIHGSGATFEVPEGILITRTLHAYIMKKQLIQFKN